MDKKEKIARLRNLSRQARKLRRLYGWDRCPRHLTEVRDEVQRALKDRAIAVWES